VVLAVVVFKAFRSSHLQQVKTKKAKFSPAPENFAREARKMIA
jgi:hypothetical protein